MEKTLILAAPPPSEDHAGIRGGYGHLHTPPLTAHAVLAACTKEWVPGVQVRCIPENERTADGTVVPRDPDAMAKDCAQADVLGLTCQFHNQDTALRLARQVKEINEQVTVVLGGPNVASRRMASMVLEHAPAVDAVVRRDGEEALLRILQGEDLWTIPGVASRVGGKPQVNRCDPIDLNAIPLWDFRNVEGWQDTLEPYDARTEAYALARTHQQVPHICVFTQRGCIKAIEGIAGGVRGRCSYCTSSELRHRTMNPWRFWRQMAHLAEIHGIQDVLVADDVLPISADYVEALYETRKRFTSVLPADVHIRAYAYPRSFQSEKGPAMLDQLRTMGVRNLFMGFECFDRQVSERANKDYFPEDEVHRTLELVHRHGIDTTVAILLGLEGETHRSLRTTRGVAFRLLDRFGSKVAGNGALTRIDLSQVAPLIGTDWYERLRNDESVCADYAARTEGGVLRANLTPDFGLLLACSLHRDGNSVSMDDIRATEKAIGDGCEAVLEKECQGGFLCTRK